MTTASTPKGPGYRVLHPTLGRAEVMEVDELWARIRLDGGKVRTVSKASLQPEPFSPGQRVRHATLGG